VPGFALAKILNRRMVISVNILSRCIKIPEI